MPGCLVMLAIAVLNNWLFPLGMAHPHHGFDLSSTRLQVPPVAKCFARLFKALLIWSSS